MNTMPPSDLLSRHAPAPRADLDHLMPSPVLGHRRRRRWTVLGAAAATLAVGALTGQLLLGQPQSAAALTQLAETAGAQPDPVIPEGMFLRIVSIGNPDSDPNDNLNHPTEFDTWTGSDGTITVYRTEGERRESWIVEPEAYAARDSYPGNTAMDVARLPADAEELLRLARGVSSDQDDPDKWRDERAFEYLLDVLRMGYASPAVNQAAITVMGMLSGVRVEQSVSYLDEPCLRVTRAEVNRAGEEASGCFEESTGDLLEWGQSSGYPHTFVSVVMSRELLDHGPTEPVDPVRTEH